MHSVESRFVIGPSNTLSDGVYYDMCTFQPGNFTCWGSEGVNVLSAAQGHSHQGYSSLKKIEGK